MPDLFNQNNTVHVGVKQVIFNKTSFLAIGIKRVHSIWLKSVTSPIKFKKKLKKLKKKKKWIATITHSILMAATNPFQPLQIRSDVTIH